jgi:hypothetical protein
MKKHLLSLALLLLCALGFVHAQTPRTIREIRQVVDVLANDRSVLHDSLVVVEGVVVTDPNDWYQAVEATRRYSFWIQEEGQPGPENGLQIRLNDGAFAPATGILNLRKGMRVRLTGTVAYFRGEIQINLSTDRQVEVLGNDVPLVDRPVFDDLTLFTDLTGTAQLETATQWEGTYITVRNLRVLNVNGNATRGNFTAEDEQGNTINVWDAHKDMRTSTNGWQKAVVDEKFVSISGILYHRLPGNQPALPGVYELHPHMPTDLVREQVPQSYKIISSSDRICAGNTVELSVVTESGDPLLPGTTVVWQPAERVVDANASSTFSVPLTETTTFSATVDDGIDAYLIDFTVTVVPNRLKLAVLEQPGAVDGRKQLLLVARGGQRPYKYSVNGGSDFRTVSRFQGLSSRTFQLVVIDDMGCILQQEYILR